MCWWRAPVGGSGEVIVPTRDGVPRSGAGSASEGAGLDRAQGFGVSGGFERECCLKEGGRSLLPMPDDMGAWRRCTRCGEETSDRKGKLATPGRSRRAREGSCPGLRESIISGKQGAPEGGHRRSLIMERIFSGWSGKMFRNTTRLSHELSFGPREIVVRTIHL